MQIIEIVEVAAERVRLARVIGMLVHGDTDCRAGLRGAVTRGLKTHGQNNEPTHRRPSPASHANHDLAPQFGGARRPYDLNIRSSFVIGSYILSTTRSFRGMIALSVMVISSGQTLVQHLVMLQ